MHGAVAADDADDVVEAGFGDERMNELECSGHRAELVDDRDRIPDVAVQSLRGADAEDGLNGISQSQRDVPMRRLRDRRG